MRALGKDSDESDKYCHKEQNEECEGYLPEFILASKHLNSSVLGRENFRSH